MKTLFSFLLLFISLSLSAQQIDLELVANGFSSPVNITNTGVPGDSRLFVVERAGKIKILNANGNVNSTPFLDISNQVSLGGERGLLGLAFHPNYENNGYFYVNYTDVNGDTQVSRFSVNPNNPEVALPDSELPLLSINQPFSNHNGGDIAFGPNGYLFIAMGDGGSGGDPGNRAQDLSVLLGKLLRIDVDNPSNGKNYGIPSSNPYAGNSGPPNAEEEIWAYGLRNPWRFSIDTVQNKIWIADVGQAKVEEINREPISSGGLNYGWRCYEGSQPYNLNGCPPQSQFTFPFVEYSSASGTNECSVTGGFVYRGNAYQNLQGLYFYADFCSGLIATVDNSGNVTEYNNFSGNWVSFGEGNNGELYIVDIGGSIYQIQGQNLSAPSAEQQLSIRLFPNPTQDTVRIRSKNTVLKSIRILDLKGKQIYEQTHISKQQMKINLSHLASGTYLIEVISEDGGKTIKKLMVE